MGVESGRAGPSGKFKIPTLQEVGTTVLQAAMMAFNTLRRIGQGLLACLRAEPHRQALADLVPQQATLQRRRLRSVLQDVMYLVCKYVRRSHRHFLKFNRMCPWLRAVEVLYARL